MMKVFVKIYWKVISLSVVLGVIDTFINIYIAKNLGIFLERSLEGNMTLLKREIMIFLLVISVYYIFQYISNVGKGAFQQKAKEQFKFHVYGNLLNNSYENIQIMESGEILTRIDSDLQNVMDTYYDSFSVLAIGIMSVLLYFLYLSKLNLVLAIAVLGLGILSLLPSMFLKNRFKINFQQYMEAEGKIKNHLNLTIEGFEFIKLNNAQKVFRNKICVLFKNISQCAFGFEKTTAEESTFRNGISNLVRYSIYGVIGYFVFNTYVDIDKALVFIILIKSITETLNNIFNKYKSIQKGKVSLNRLEELVGHQEDKGYEKIRSISSIEFINVSFKYKDREILKNLNFKIKKGDKVLIKGPNGSGKSTILKLILGIYTGYAGVIKVNDIDLKNINKKMYRENIGLLTQNQLFFSNVPEENLMLFKEDRSRMKELLKTFSINEGCINEVGCYNLSGGEKQKLGIIRTVLKDSDLFVLDEPTNHMDKDGKEKLKILLRDLNSTLIVVEHDYFLHDIFNKIIDMNCYEEVGV